MPSKIRLAPLENASLVLERGLEDEADQLCAIFSSIITNMSIRLGDEDQRKRRRRMGPDG